MRHPLPFRLCGKSRAAGTVSRPTSSILYGFSCSRLSHGHKDLINAMLRTEPGNELEEKYFNRTFKIPCCRSNVSYTVVIRVNTIAFQLITIGLAFCRYTDLVITLVTVSCLTTLSPIVKISSVFLPYHLLLFRPPELLYVHLNNPFSSLLFAQTV